MVRTSEMPRSDRRRNVLRLLGSAAGVGLLSVRSSAQQDDGSGDDGQFHVQQGDQCAPIVPLSGDRPVEELYQYAYPREQFDGPPGVTGTSYSSEGTVPLQRENGSVLFLYDGPEGLSLVFVHGRRDEEEAERPAGESTTGGTVSFSVRGLSEEGQWVVLDDYYGVDGRQSESNYDRYEFHDDRHDLHWAYRGGRTDGGVFRGLGSDPDVEVQPAFNDAAELADDHAYGTVETWEVLSGDLEDPERRPLDLDAPVRIAAGECPEGDAGGEWSDETEDRTDE